MSEFETTHVESSPYDESLQKPVQPLVIYPLSEINQSLEYSIMYQPVYVSTADQRIYSAGPLLQNVDSPASKAFIQSLSETLSIAGKNIDQSFERTGKKLDEAIRPVSEKVAEKLQPVGTKLNETMEKVGEKLAPIGEKIGEAANHVEAEAKARYDKLVHTIKENE